MFVVLLNVILSMIVIAIAVILTIIAIILIIVSLVRSSKAKKENRKTSKVGLWIGIAMLVIPWLIAAAFFVASKIYDADNNRWIPDRAALAGAVIKEDADEIYDMMADHVVDEEDISVEDIEGFLKSCNIEKVSSSDIKRYSEFSSEYNHYRNYTSHDNGRAQTCFQYNMYNVNDEGGKIFITGVDGDAEGAEYVGIYYISYTAGDETSSIGVKPPAEH
ncbi:hypothetical protein SAMN02910456_01317 [Ruminococcaceae bacterium YRB3002]|nr:hypothetical protein SAMN02910456_01317 [Ruminococcaceae bacterium YRB3002]